MVLDVNTPAARVATVDTLYTGQPEIAAAYLVEGESSVAFVETNTNAAVPRLLAALGERGWTPEQVEYVIVTHIHLDHAGGAGQLMQHCPNATLLAHPRAAPHAIDPARIIAGAKQVYGEQEFAALYGDIAPVPAERVEALEDGDTRRLGDRTLTFLHTRGHANHHFCIHDDRSAGVFTGDSFGLLYPTLQRAGTLALVSSTPTDFDAEAAHASVDRIVATGAERVFPTHFGAHGGLREAADQLHRQLDAYAAVVEAGDAGGSEGEQLDRFCLERVRAVMSSELEARGLAGDRALWKLLELDIELNAQGLAFAVRKLRYKRSKAAATKG